MQIDVDNLVLIATTLIGLAGAIFTQQKYATAKANIVEVIGDAADLLALVYDMSKSGDCNADRLKAIGSKVEEIWTDIESLGPTFAALLAQKSSLAEALKPTEQKEAS